jgi:hypothetical protein
LRYGFAEQRVSAAIQLIQEIPLLLSFDSALQAAAIMSRIVIAGQNDGRDRRPCGGRLNVICNNSVVCRYCGQYGHWLISVFIDEHLA